MDAQGEATVSLAGWYALNWFVFVCFFEGQGISAMPSLPE